MVKYLLLLMLFLPEKLWCQDEMPTPDMRPPSAAFEGWTTCYNNRTITWLRMDVVEGDTAHLYGIIAHERIHQEQAKRYGGCANMFPMLSDLKFVVALEAEAWKCANLPRDLKREGDDALPMLLQTYMKKIYHSLNGKLDIFSIWTIFGNIQCT